MKSDFSNASASFKKRNPTLFTPLTPFDPNFETQGPVPPDAKAKPARRLRQDKPPNKLEAAWLEVLKYRYPGAVIHAQSMRFKLASGAWYKPDACACVSDSIGISPRWTAWETKFLKGKNADRGILALKCAAHQFPEICFVLVWKDEDGQWKEQIVKP